MSVYLPEMIIKLKQEIGRLIRCDTDKGIIAILHSKIGDSSKSLYKNQVFNCIKSLKKTSDLEYVKNKNCIKHTEEYKDNRRIKEIYDIINKEEKQYDKDG